jgi:two-component system LytT family response regulator
VQIDAVREIQPWFSGDYLAILRDGTELRVSRRYKDAILKQFL